MSQKEVKVVLTGGHAGATAYALIQEIKKHKKDYHICWIGAKYAIEGAKLTTFEYNVFPSIGVIYYPIITGRIQRKFTFWTIPSILKIPIGFIHALLLLIKIRPKVILSFGGYASFPVVVMGWILRIPVIIHEQTIVFGRANKYSSFFANKIALARDESLKYFPHQKCVVVGNPISAEIKNVKPKKKIGNHPTIFIIGGSRGSQAINDLAEDILSKLLEKYYVIHQTGALEFKKFMDIKLNLSSKLNSRYEVHDFIFPNKWYKFIARADLIISRAGANIVSEVIISKRPAIFIPLPITFMDEQTKNAEYVAKLGFAKVLNQRDLTPDTLFREIEERFLNWNEMVKKASNIESPDKNASEKLLKIIEEEIKNSEN